MNVIVEAVLEDDDQYQICLWNMSKQDADCRLTYNLVDLGTYRVNAQDRHRLVKKFKRIEGYDVFIGEFQFGTRSLNGDKTVVAKPFKLVDRVTTKPDVNILVPPLQYQGSKLIVGSV